MITEITSIGLIVFLVTKQLCDASTSEYTQRLGRIITIPIVSLLLVVMYMIADRVNEII